MRPRTILVVFSFLIAAAGLALVARGLMRPPTPTVHSSVVTKEAPMAKVLVAAEHIGRGQFIKPELYEWKPWPKGALDERFIVKDQFKPADVAGAVAKEPLEKGDPIFANKIVKPGQGGFLAAVLQPGMRAVSVNVNRVTGNAGLILPGDIVDLVLTGKVDARDAEQRDHYVGQTVLHKLRVLAIDQTMDNKDQAKVAQTATLEVTPKDAEKVLVAEQLGQLSLVLRSLAVADNADAPMAARDSKPELTWDRDVSLAIKLRGYGEARPKQSAPAQPAVVVMRGRSRSNVAVSDPAAPPPNASSDYTAAALSPDVPAAMPGQ
jgi:pilus assembly protein CpaB